MTSSVIRVLIVDDDSRDIQLTTEALSSISNRRYRTFIASGIEQASKHIDEKGVDVVLLDFQVCDADNTDSVRQLRERFPLVPIVALTSTEKEGAAMASLSSGAQEYLCRKDSTLKELDRAIRRAIQRQQVSRQQTELIRQLRSSNELLEQKNKRLDDLYITAQQFVDNVSHEFRTPLTVIKEFCSITCEGLAGPVNEQQKEFLTIALSRIDDLASMVDDMLDISKLEAGVLSVWRQTCGVSEIIEQVKPVIERRATSHKIEVLWEIPDDLPKLFCDTEKVGRIIINLAVNGIKFCNEQGQVTISAVAEPDSAQVRFSVRDNGPGIRPENLTAIFKRFKQLGGSARKSAKGFGLGLSIVKELTHLNFGELHVESEVGQGSCFEFTIPTTDSQALIRRYLDRVDAIAERPQSVYLLTVAPASKSKSDPTSVIDEFLQSYTRPSDIALKSQHNGWVLATNCLSDEVAELCKRIQDEWKDLCRNRPGGGLPRLSIETVGSWHIQAERETLEKAFREQISAPPQEESKRSILLVDDDLELIRALQVRMQAAGYNVITAPSGEQGFSDACNNRPDAIVLDVRMPGMDGIETLERLKQETSTMEIPVVMLSASIVDQQLALNRGARFFLSKPYDARTVISAVESSFVAGA